MSDRLVRAAGVVAWRVTSGVAEPEVLVVHRPRHGDWSLPKGKLDPGETWAAAAVRELEEETGVRCRLGPEVAGVAYRVGGAPKLVRYWSAQVPAASADGFTANDEVDAVRWSELGEAMAVVDYVADRAVLRSFRHVVAGLLGSVGEVR